MRYIFFSGVSHIVLGDSLRILLVNHALSVGGAEIMLLDLAAEQKKLGHTVTVCSMYGKGPLDERAQEYGIPVVHLNSTRKLRTQVKLLRAYLREHPQDVIHSHYGVWLPAAISGFLTKTPLIHTHHGNESRRMFLKHRIAVLFTARVATLLPNVDDYIGKWVGVPKRKIVVVPNGIALARVNGVPRVELDGIPATATVVGMVARLSPPKDYSTFMRAAKLVLDKSPDVHFVAVGDGKQRAQFEAEKAQLAIPNFHFLGSRLDVPAILHRLTINVLATRDEGSSIILMEAMASGCACVATDLPATRFVLDDGNSGLLVPGSDPAAMAAAIEELLGDSELRAKLHEGAVKRSQYLSAARMADDYLTLYGQLRR